MRIGPLPPLQYLVAFEAAVRHASFTRAAEELNLTQGAISRQIHQLEDFLGRALFVRGHRALRLTAAGEQYSNEVSSLLGHCADATQRIMRRPTGQQLTVACSSGVSMFWLTPRLSRFIEAYPDIQLRLIVRDELAQLSPGEFDVGIYYVRENPSPHFDLTKILNEDVCPACSPSYLDGRTISLSDLTNERLLLLEDGLRPWITWPEWFRLKGLAMPARSPSTIASNSYLQLLHLAIMGHGIVLVWRPMIDSFLERGLLTIVTDESAEHGGGYYVLHANDRLQSPAARQFTEWLFEQRRVDQSQSTVPETLMPFPISP